jgi:uncharacterized membrane protein YcaP (DUF421 family)
MHVLMPEITILEKVVRSAAVYFFLLVAFRLVGKRSVGQMTPFDLVVLLVISNVLQNAMIGADNSIGGGLIGAATVFLLNSVVARITFRSRKAELLVESPPRILIHNGKILQENLSSELVTRRELSAALRKHGLEAADQVKLAVLEDDGSISIIPRR